MLATMIFENAGDECQLVFLFINVGVKYYQLENSEILATNVIIYNVQKGWRQMWTIVVFRNVGDKG